MITRIVDQFPIAGKECRFTLKDESVFIGFYDHGGAINWSCIYSSDGTKQVYNQKGIGLDSYDLILGWEYIKK